MIQDKLNRHLVVAALEVLSMTWIFHVLGLPTFVLLLAFSASAEDNGRELRDAVRANDMAKVLEVLKMPGIDVNSRSKHGETALHIAASRGLLEMAKLLLTRNADVNAKDEDGDTPLDLARRKGHQGMAVLLSSQNENARQTVSPQKTESHSGDHGKPRAWEARVEDLPVEPSSGKREVTSQAELEVLNCLEEDMRFGHKMFAKSDFKPVSVQFDQGKSKGAQDITMISDSKGWFIHAGEIMITFVVAHGAKFAFRLRGEQGKWLKVECRCDHPDPISPGPPQFYWPRQTMRIFDANGYLLRTIPFKEAK